MTKQLRVRELRKRKGYDQWELSIAAGLYYQTIGATERGETSPSKRTLEKLAKALGVTVDELYED